MMATCAGTDGGVELTAVTLRATTPQILLQAGAGGWSCARCEPLFVSRETRGTDFPFHVKRASPAHVNFESQLRARLEAAEHADLLRAPQAHDVGPGTVMTAGESLVSFASNDYLGLTEHPRLRRALEAGAAYGAGAGSSRVVTGTSPAHLAAEAALAALVQLPSARVFPSAYSANLGLLGSLFGRGDLLLSDSLNHASLIDGCRLSRAEVRVFEHGNLEHLRALLREHRASARVVAIVTETAFSMDGDVADVSALRRIADEHDAALVVDEAHALGVMGPGGRGACAAAGVEPDVLIGGLGKAFGLAGGFLAGSLALGRAVDNFARTFVFSTAILPSLALAIPTAVDLVRAADHERAVLAQHADRIRASVRAAGRSVLGDRPGVILPIIVGAPSEALRISSALRRRGLLVPAMRPPTVAPGTARLRITPTALHTDEQISALCAGLGEALPASPRNGDYGDQRDHA
jgi:8-amino-7-oxononanoate synthase